MSTFYRFWFVAPTRYASCVPSRPILKQSHFEPALSGEKSAVDGTTNSGFLSAFEMNIFSETQALAGISRHKPSNQAQANERARVGYAFSDFFNTIGSTKTVSPALPIQMCPSCTVALIRILRSAILASACVASIGSSVTSKFLWRMSAA